MGWDDGYNDNQWDSVQGQSPVMYYLNYVLVIGCLVILVSALFFIFRECCQGSESGEEMETIIMRLPEAQVPSYTESTCERDQSHYHRIIHEYNHQSQVPFSPGSQGAPRHYYTYDHKHPTTYYSYPTSCNAVSSSTSATAPSQQNNALSQPPREDERPPPYAPHN